MDLLSTCGTPVGLGIQSNQRHEPLMATYLADFGWEVLEVAKGVGEGLLLWGENTVDMVRHPVQTVQNMVYGVGMLVWAAAKVVHVPIKLSAMCIEGKYELARLQAEEIYAQSQQLIEACQTQLAQTSNRELAKHATAICADFFLTGQVLGLMKKTCARAAPALIGAVEFLKEEREVEYVVAAAEGPLVQLSEKAKQVGGAGEAAKQAARAGETAREVGSTTAGAKKIGSAAEAAVQGVRTFLESLRQEFMARLEPEIIGLRDMFEGKLKGFAEFKNKFIKFPYEHIFGMEFRFNRNGLAKISGFHHDFETVVERSGAFKFVNKVVYKGGWYRADIFYQGSCVKKGATFFPAHWSREEVMRKVYDVCARLLETGEELTLQANETYKITQLIEEGIEIEMFMTGKGKITTAYPVFK